MVPACHAQLLPATFLESTEVRAESTMMLHAWTAPAFFRAMRTIRYFVILHRTTFTFTMEFVFCLMCLLLPGFATLATIEILSFLVPLLGRFQIETSQI